MKNFDPDKILRENIKVIKPYSSARDEFEGEADVWLDANENYEYFSSIPANRYPDPYQKAVKLKLSEINDIPAENIFLGNGSDEVIDLLIRAYAEPKEDKVLLLPPTYGVYQVYSDINNVETVSVLLDENFDLDTERILNTIETDSNIKLIFICSPNNPSGNKMNLEKIKKVLDNFNGIVCADEAYQDFAESESLISLVPEYSNLVVMQTMSKAWGMAALRLGTAYADERIIKALTNIKPPYNINLYTQQEALKVLSKAELKENSVIQIIKDRKELSKRLSEFSFTEKVYPSESNFILVKVKDADNLYNYLKGKGIVIRNRNRVTGCDNCVRITIGNEKENSLLLQELKKYERL